MERSTLEYVCAAPQKQPAPLGCPFSLDSEQAYMWIHALRCSASIVLGVWTAVLATAAVADSGTPAANPTPTWGYAAKTGIGTSYEAYENGTYRDGGRTGALSKVWFSLAGGVLTETMYGLI